MIRRIIKVLKNEFFWISEREEEERIAEEQRKKEEEEYAERLKKLEEQAEKQRQREKEIEERWENHAMCCNLWMKVKYEPHFDLSKPWSN